MSGGLYLIGVGPGDPELLTLKAVRVLGEIENVFYIKKPKGNAFAYGIAKNHINENACLMAFDMEMENERFRANKTYDEIAREILLHLEKGQNVAYICEGDGLFYGSANYLIKRMPQHIKVEIIAGITSPQAASAALKRPLIMGNEVFKTLPAILDDEALLSELQSAKSVAILKVGRHIQRIKNLLEKTNYLENAKIVEYASSEKERVSDLRDFEGDSLPYFAIILSRRSKKK